ncbi:MAG TPA: efflux RND transporter periplasmic adaptor subunit [Steroidobacteraceae bacterium]|nr:efflux RND transporter periplasmic adaptor subunit [Steroidobacteraceae bacterium]
MDGKTALLDELRLGRGIRGGDGGDGRDRDSRRWMLLASGAVLVLAIGAGVAWALSRPGAINVEAAVVREAGGAQPPGAPSSGISMLDASGYVVARRAATVASKTIGRLVEVTIEEGQRVEAGQIIARLDDSNARATLEQSRAQLAQAQANLDAAREALDDARPIYSRNEQQMKAGVISAQTFDNARATYNASRSDHAVRVRGVEVARASLAVAQRNFEDTIVRAPFAGVITVKAAQAGEIVSPQSSGGFTRTGIGTIVDMESLEVEVDVSENFINRVQTGQTAVVRLNAYPDWEIPAAVIAVVPTADRSKATVKVRVGFKQRDERVLPEMGARVSFLRPASGTEPSAAAAVAAVMVPTDAVQVSGDNGTVFIVNDDIIEQRAVRLGSRTSAGQIVLSGLAAGTRVVVGNLEALSDGAKVRIASTVTSRQGETP